MTHIEQQYDQLPEQLRKASAFGGGLLLVYGLRQRSWSGLLAGITGAGLLYYTATGRNPLQPAMEMLPGGDAAGIEVRQSVTINRPADEIYGFWRNLENLPLFMEHLESVQELGNGISRWQAKMVAGQEVSWEARITAEEPGRRLAWETLPDSEVQHEGEVRLVPSQRHGETELHVNMSYRPPMGGLGAAFGRLLNGVTEQQIREDIRNVKHILEAGEIPTVEGQPSGRR